MEEMEKITRSETVKHFGYGLPAHTLAKSNFLILSWNRKEGWAVSGSNPQNALFTSDIDVKVITVHSFHCMSHGSN